MFTGLVEEIGNIESIQTGAKSAKIKIRSNKVLEGVKLGDSICTNGVCLTVTEFSKDSFTVDVMAESMRRSNLCYLKKGDRVNLERALRVGDRLGGHVVSGHIDGIGKIQAFEKEDNATWVSIETPKDILKYIVMKGSIAIDGVSLTVAYVDDNMFKVSIIPHTKDETTLLKKNVGDYVNLEGDVIGKYVEKLLGMKKETENKKSSIDMNFLKNNGFM